MVKTIYGVMISIHVVVKLIYDVINFIYSVVKSIYDIVISIYSVLKPIYNIGTSIYYVNKSIYHVVKSIFSVIKSIYNVLTTIYYVVIRYMMSLHDYEVFSLLWTFNGPRFFTYIISIILTPTASFPLVPTYFLYFKVWNSPISFLYKSKFLSASSVWISSVNPVVGRQ